MLTAIAAAPAPVRFFLAVACGLLGGWLCVQLRTPLPWMIGPLFGSALLNIRGANLFSPIVARNAGQWVIGTALGLYFTREAVLRLASVWLPLIISIVYTIALGLFFAWALRRFARADPATAFFGGSIGGASEMALNGERHGGSIETIAAVHTLRIMLVVVIVPFMFQWLGVNGQEAWQGGRREVVPSALVWLVGVTVASGFVMRTLRSPNAWMIGPLLASITMTYFGWANSAMPQWAINTGQLVIGISLGTRFRPGFFQRAPVLVRVVVAVTLIAIALSGVLGWLLARMSGVDAATMILAMAPGGVAEMSLTAKLLQLGVPIVTSFHLVRFVSMVLLAGMFYRLLARRLGWQHDLHPDARRKGEDDD